LALLLTGGMTATAGAAPAPVTCAQATAQVAVGQDRVQAEAADVREAEDDLQTATNAQVDAQEALDALLTDGILGNEAVAEAALEAAEGITGARQRALAAQQGELQGAQNDLAELIRIQERACDEPVVVTTTPKPTPTVAPTTTTPPPAPNVIVGDDVIGEDNDITITIGDDNDPDDGVRYRPNTSGGIATG
jgi:hypothetical protein